jgi:hypothetical protein
MVKNPASMIVRALVKGFSAGVMLLVDTGKLVYKYPVFLFPLTISSLFLGSYTYLYEMTSFFSQFTDAQAVGGVLFLYSFTLTFTGSLTMEWIQHIENGYSPKFWNGLKATLLHNLPRLLPVAGLWMTVWLMIILVEIVLDFIIDKLTFSLAERARWAAIRETMDFVRKGLRMFFFLNLPAVGWQDHGPVSSLKRSWSIVKNHFREFSEGYLGTYFIGFVLSLFSLAILPFYFSGTVTEREMRLFAIVYGSIGTSLIFFMEQLFAGKLFLQVLQWEAMKQDDPDLDLDDVDKPKFHDDVPDFRRSD